MRLTVVPESPRSPPHHHSALKVQRILYAYTYISRAGRRPSTGHWRGGGREEYGIRFSFCVFYYTFFYPKTYGVPLSDFINILLPSQTIWFMCKSRSGLGVHTTCCFNIAPFLLFFLSFCFLLHCSKYVILFDKNNIKFISTKVWTVKCIGRIIGRTVWSSQTCLYGYVFEYNWTCNKM